MTASKYDDTAAKLMIYPAVLSMVFGMLVGVFISYNAFVFPDYFQGEYVTFGRLRPMHVNGVAVMWLLSAGVGLIYYLVPRLCGIPLWSTKLAKLQAFLWWFSLLIGVLSFPSGSNFGWEYAEIPTWVGFLPTKLLFVGSFVLVLVNIFVTVINRVYKKMYVSLWYAMGTLVWTSLIFTAGNLGLWLVPDGISRVNLNYFYVHNLVGLTFTPLGVAIAYYFVPKASGAPLYSHRLSMVGFWTIAFVYPWVGAHHIIHGPVSQWLQTTSIVFSIWLILPVLAVVTNLFATMKGRWQTHGNEPALQFLMMGNLFYMLTALQGMLQAMRNLNEITSKTDWVVGHAHMALLGGFTFFTIGGLYHAIPVIAKKPWWSKSLGTWHFVLTFIGAFLMFSSLFVGGFLQGMDWASWATGTSYEQFHHNLSQLSFLQTIAFMKPWWGLRSISGLFLLAGSIVFAINVFNTIMLKTDDEELACSKV